MTVYLTDRKMRKSIFAALMTGLVLCSCGGKKTITAQQLADVLTPCDSMEIRYAPGIKAGTQAPAIEAPDSSGTMHKLSDFKGDFVFVDFWASWCGDCRREIPEVKAIYDQYKDVKLGNAPIRFMSVSFDHDGDAWRKMLRKEQFPWLQIGNTMKKKDDPVNQAYQVNWIPSYFIIAPDGTVLYAAVTAARAAEVMKALDLWYNK